MLVAAVEEALVGFRGGAAEVGRGEGAPYFVLLLFVSQPDALDVWCGVFWVMIVGCYDFCLGMCDDDGGGCFLLLRLCGMIWCGLVW